MGGKPSLRKLIVTHAYSCLLGYRHVQTCMYCVYLWSCASIGENRFCLHIHTRTHTHTHAAVSWSLRLERMCSLLQIKKQKYSDQQYCAHTHTNTHTHTHTHTRHTHTRARDKNRIAMICSLHFSSYVVRSNVDSTFDSTFFNKNLALGNVWCFVEKARLDICVSGFWLTTG